MSYYRKVKECLSICTFVSSKEPLIKGSYFKRMSQLCIGLNKHITFRMSLYQLANGAPGTDAPVQVVMACVVHWDQHLLQAAPEGSTIPSTIRVMDRVMRWMSLTGQPC